jgi:hypothetical protein
VVAQRALAALVSVAIGLALRALALRDQALQLSLDALDALLAPGVVALRLGWVVADDEALGALAVTDVDFLDAQVVLDGGVAAWRESACSVWAIPERSFIPAM